MTGRFAPSPTGDLHIGNLRTALVSWLECASKGSSWLVRFEDLDGVVADPKTAARQLDDLASLGMEPVGHPLWQSAHLDRYTAAIDVLVRAGRTYPCFCSRREIREAIAASASAPNGPTAAAYPGTCASLTEAERAERAEGRDRPAALRFRSDGEEVAFTDRESGPQVFEVDDFVVQRNDEVPAYNLVVVVDDAYQGVSDVVRADDLLSSTARQILVARALGLDEFNYVHVPLVVNRAGERLSKRDGSMTMVQLAELGWSATDVLRWLARSMGLVADSASSAVDLVSQWEDRPGSSEWSNVWTPPSAGS